MWKQGQTQTKWVLTLWTPNEKKNHQQAITSNCLAFPTRGDQYIYEQVCFYFSCLHVLLEALNELYRTGCYSGVVGSLSAWSYHTCLEGKNTRWFGVFCPFLSRQFPSLFACQYPIVCICLLISYLVQDRLTLLHCSLCINKEVPIIPRRHDWYSLIRWPR